MAYLPDIAVTRSAEVSPGAFRLYAYYCMRRDHDTGLCFPKLKTAAAELSMNYTHASEVRHELVVKGWIEVAGSTVRPLLGFVEKHSEKPERSEIPECSEKSEPSSEISEPTSEKSELNVRKFPNSHIKELTSPINQTREPDQRTKRGGRASPPAFDARAVELEPWLRRETWVEWVEFHDNEYRSRDGKRAPPLSPSTAAKQVKFLKRQWQAGVAPERVIEQSIMRQWQGLFPVKGEDDGGEKHGGGPVLALRRDSRKRPPDGGGWDVKQRLGAG